MLIGGFVAPFAYAQRTTNAPLCVSKNSCNQIIQSYEKLADQNEAYGNVKVTYQEDPDLCPEKNSDGAYKEGRCLASPASIPLQVPIPQAGLGVLSNVTGGFPQYLDAVFRFLVGAASVVTVTFFIWGGYLYLTASGNQSSISRAKETIGSALIGLLLALGSFFILNIINSKLVYKYNLRTDAIVPATMTVDKTCPKSLDKACGGIYDLDDGWCRGTVCPNSNEVCLSDKEKNAIYPKQFSCYPKTEEGLERACDNSFPERCKEVSEAVFASNPFSNNSCFFAPGNPRNQFVAEDSEISCSWLKLLTCENGWQQVECEEDVSSSQCWVDQKPAVKKKGVYTYTCKNGRQSKFPDDSSDPTIQNAICCQNSGTNEYKLNIDL